MSRNIYLALGDSITAGMDTSHPTLSFVKHVSEFLKSKSITERTVVIAQPGWTAKRLFQMGSTLPNTLWDNVGIATICIGSSDFSRLLKPRRLSLDGNPFSPRAILQKADEFGYHTDQLFQLVKNKEIPHVLVTTLYNPFPSFMPAGHFIEGINSIIRDCASYYKFSVVDVDKRFTNNEAYFIQGYRTGGIEDLMTPLRKPILPNNAGHRLIADLITQRLTQLLTKGSNNKHSGSRRQHKATFKKLNGLRKGKSTRVRRYVSMKQS